MRTNALTIKPSKTPQDRVDRARLRGDDPAAYAAPAREAGLHAAVNKDVQVMLAGALLLKVYCINECVKVLRLLACLRCWRESRWRTWFYSDLFTVCS